MKNQTLYAIILSKVEGSELTKAIIDQHVEHLRSLKATDQLVLCGPFSDHPSGLVVVNVENKDQATQIAMQDPFVREGVRTFEIRTWQIACEENNYLA